MPACAQTGHAELVEAPGLLELSVVDAWNAGPSTSSDKLGVNGIEPIWIDLLVAANDQNHCGPVKSRSSVAPTLGCRTLRDRS
jgi:hypothetical protein